MRDVSRLGLRGMHAVQCPRQVPYNMGTRRDRRRNDVCAGGRRVAATATGLIMLWPGRSAFPIRRGCRLPDLRIGWRFDGRDDSQVAPSGGLLFGLGIRPASTTARDGRRVTTSPNRYRPTRGMTVRPAVPVAGRQERVDSIHIQSSWETDLMASHDNISRAENEKRGQEQPAKVQPPERPNIPPPPPPPSGGSK